MANPLDGKRVLLGVTGSIACYKAADLASKLRQAGALVDVILTQSALQFVTPLTFQSVTGRPAYTEADLWGATGHVLHIELAELADVLVIAPATANTLAKMAAGIADNFLSVATLAARGPVMAAPAMDGGMYAHPATQANIEVLRSRGVIFAGPAAGHLASGQSGVGRMMEPVEILGILRQLLARQGPLAGRHILVTAGGTHEPIDPVRVIANKSSGKQGFAVAQAALDLGAAVTLVTGPTALPVPTGATLIRVETAAEMLDAVLGGALRADVLVMAAAVADFRPQNTANQKIKKGKAAPVIELALNPDILKEVAGLPADKKNLKVVVGFAAESESLIENAKQKLSTKKLDLIVANDISAEGAGFAVDTNQVTFLFADGTINHLPQMTKSSVAEKIMQVVTHLLISKINSV